MDIEADGRGHVCVKIIWAMTVLMIRQPDLITKRILGRKKITEEKCEC